MNLAENKSRFESDLRRDNNLIKVFCDSTNTKLNYTKEKCVEHFKINSSNTQLMDLKRIVFDEIESGWAYKGIHFDPKLDVLSNGEALETILSEHNIHTFMREAVAIDNKIKACMMAIPFANSAYLLMVRWIRDESVELSGTSTSQWHIRRANLDEALTTSVAAKLFGVRGKQLTW